MNEQPLCCGLRDHRLTGRHMLSYKIECKWCGKIRMVANRMNLYRSIAHLVGE